MHLFDGKDLDAIERFPKAERIGVGDISKFHGAILAGVVVPRWVGMCGICGTGGWGWGARSTSRDRAGS